VIARAMATKRTMLLSAGRKEFLSAFAGFALISLNPRFRLLRIRSRWVRAGRSDSNYDPVEQHAGARDGLVLWD
jgi:hypothetical protein